MSPPFHQLNSGQLDAQEAGVRVWLSSVIALVVVLDAGSSLLIAQEQQQSLTDVATKEAERRQTVTLTRPSTVLSNAELSDSAPPSTPVVCGTEEYHDISRIGGPLGEARLRELVIRRFQERDPRTVAAYTSYIDYMNAEARIVRTICWRGLQIVGAWPVAGDIGATAAAISSEQARWNEIGKQVMDYFVLQAGARDSEPLRQGFIAWLKRSPDRLEVYMHGNVNSRKALVDLYLKQVFP
jgi:hypothetical protein